MGLIKYVFFVLITQLPRSSQSSLFLFLFSSYLHTGSVVGNTRAHFCVFTGRYLTTAIFFIHSFATSTEWDIQSQQTLSLLCCIVAGAECHALLTVKLLTSTGKNGSLHQPKQICSFKTYLSLSVLFYSMSLLAWGRSSSQAVFDTKTYLLNMPDTQESIYSLHCKMITGNISQA